MGEASRRKAEISALKAIKENWKNSLLNEERVIAHVSEVAFQKIVVGLGTVGGCYHMAFFLYKYLRERHQIDVNICVGYVNDGQWEGATSHAWIEYAGKKVDISLHQTADPLNLPSGDLIVLDFALKKGAVRYAYWTEIPASAAQAMEVMGRSSAELRETIEFKIQEHKRMLEHSQHDEGIDQYFRGAPPSGTYEFLSRLMK